MHLCAARHHHPYARPTSGQLGNPHLDFFPRIKTKDEKRRQVHASTIPARTFYPCSIDGCPVSADNQAQAAVGSKVEEWRSTRARGPPKPTAGRHPAVPVRARDIPSVPAGCSRCGALLCSAAASRVTMKLAARRWRTSLSGGTFRYAGPEDPG